MHSRHVLFRTILRPPESPPHDVNESGRRSRQREAVPGCSGHDAFIVAQARVVQLLDLLRRRCWVSRRRLRQFSRFHMVDFTSRMGGRRVVDGSAYVICFITDLGYHNFGKFSMGISVSSQTGRACALSNGIRTGAPARR